MITDTITEEARELIRQMQGEIERLTNQLVSAVGLLREISGCESHHPGDVVDLARRFLSTAPLSRLTDELRERSEKCPNGLDHGACLYPECVPSCPGRLSVT